MTPPATGTRAGPAKQVLAWAPAVAWAALIFAFSATPDLRLVPDDVVDFVLRKVGHMAVFGVLAVLMWRALSMSVTTSTTSTPAVPKPRVRLWALLLAVLYAGSDELHQATVSGRHGSAVDVGIDATGALLGVLAWGAVRDAVAGNGQ